ncbi:phosphatase PAP2 family protein [Streptomyces polyrhachis]|uniref:Phosphatase PAP2 family protein n=1 Tax=Streptomyces polyrhachis TaxID=1282885 RepID=A0ABW2GED5_9ACTN
MPPPTLLPPAPALPCAKPARLLLAATAACFTVLLVLVAAGWGPLMAADRRVAVALHRSAVSSPTWTHTARVFTDWVWDPWTMRLALLVAVVWLLRRGERRTAAWVFATGLLATLLQQGLKAAVGRERPYWPDPVDSARYAAFPSGHAMSAAVACGLLLWLLRRYGTTRRTWHLARGAAAGTVVGVGFTRVYLGVHWPSDVLGGWLLGALLAGASVCLYGTYGRSLPAGRGRSLESPP